MLTLLLRLIPNSSSHPVPSNLEEGSACSPGRNRHICHAAANPAWSFDPSGSRPAGGGGEENGCPCGWCHLHPPSCGVSEGGARRPFRPLSESVAFRCSVWAALNSPSYILDTLDMRKRQVDRCSRRLLAISLCSSLQTCIDE